MSEATAEETEKKPITPEEPEIDPKAEEKPADGEGKGEEEPPKLEGSEEAEEEMVLVREGSQPGKQTRHVSQRINRIGAKLEKETKRADGSEIENQSLKDQLSITRLALEQERGKTKAPVRPKEDDFDEGISDPNYIKALDEYDDFRLDQKLEAKISKQTQTSTQNIHQEKALREYEKKEDAHIQRAESFKAKNFNEVQNKAIEYLGSELVKAIITDFPDSELIIYYYGTNEAEARDLMKVMEKSQVMGVDAIAGLRRELKVQPKSKIVPDPDDEIPGSSSANTAIQTSFEKKLQKLRDNLDRKELGGIRAIVNLKKEAKEKGVILE